MKKFGIIRPAQAPGQLPQASAATPTLRCPVVIRAVYRQRLPAADTSMSSTMARGLRLLKPARERSISSIMARAYRDQHRQWCGED